MRFRNFPENGLFFGVSQKEPIAFIFLDRAFPVGRCAEPARLSRPAAAAGRRLEEGSSGLKLCRMNLTAIGLFREMLENTQL